MEPSEPAYSNDEIRQIQLINQSLHISPEERIVFIDGSDQPFIDYEYCQGLQELLKLVVATGSQAVEDAIKEISKAKGNEEKANEALRKLSDAFATLTQFVNEASTDKESLTHEEAARTVGVSTSTLYKWHEKGKLRGFRPNNGKLVWSKTVIDEWTRKNNGISMLESGDTKLNLMVSKARKKAGLE